MRRLFTLTVMALLLSIAGADAQNYRKWNFTRWSATTIDNLKAEDAAGGVSGAGWSSTEKANGDNAQPDNCYWSYAEANVNADGALQANGAVIAETEGLLFNPAYAVKRNLAIAVNYPSTSLGEYAGPQYLWLGGGNAKSASARIACFTIPKVKIGQKITFVAESHKPSDARGVALYVSDVTNDANQIGDKFTPTTLDTYTWENWTLPEGITDEDGDGLVDLLVVNTNGCHIYSIEVGDDTQKSKIAYLYQEKPSDVGTQLGLIANYEVESIDVATATKTAEELRQYDVVVVDPYVASSAWAGVLKQALGWTPIVNTSYGLYEAWGLGKAQKQSEPVIILKDAANSLFSGIEVIEDPDAGIKGIAIEGDDVYAIEGLGQYFADDEIAATGMDGENYVAAHVHNGGHNAYIYVPAGHQQLLTNAVKAAAASKAPVTAAPKPTIKFEYGDMKTQVVISSNIPGAKIYCTTDGAEPTTANAYTEPFWVDSELTVKACAEGDGYTMSEVAEAQVPLRHQALRPAIAVEQQAGSALVTLTGATEGADIFYNFDANSDSTKSTKYTGPFTIMKSATLTAFAASQEYVVSELLAQDVSVDKPIAFTEVLAHMDAAKEPYYSKQWALQEAGEASNTASNSKVAYFFSWGKSKTSYPYYDTTADPIGTTVDPETGDETPVYPKSAEEKFDFENGWAVRSRGHIIVEEITIKPGKDIAGDGARDGLGVSTTYNPATATDLEFSETYPCTDFYLNISEWNTSDPRSGIIYTTKKVKGPFAILSYISNGNAGTGPSVVFETGDDIDGDSEETQWSIIGDTCVLDQGQRLYRKFVRLYSGSDEVYVRTRIANGGSKAGFYDIYILGVDPAFITGISDVADRQPSAAKPTAVYSISGVRRQQAQRGLNIVVENGEARKVIVK